MVKEYFPEIGKIQFEGKESKNPMAYRYYDANKEIMGKKMSEWLKFAMAWWHTLCADGSDGRSRRPAACRHGHRHENRAYPQCHRNRNQHGHASPCCL